MHTVFMMGDDDIRLHLADNVAHLKAHLIIIGQQAIHIVKDIALAPQLLCEGLCLRNFIFTILGNIRPGRRALFTGGQRQGHSPAPMDGTGGKQRTGGQLGITDVGTDGQNGMCFHHFTAPSAERQRFAPRETRRPDK